MSHKTVTSGKNQADEEDFKGRKSKIRDESKI